uniref:Flavin-containing monooxygenase n=1 Tax=Ananas comosus var. bracteatus TaxID=296719 RepID=A0A6V7QTR9_ANACO
MDSSRVTVIVSDDDVEVEKAAAAAARSSITMPSPLQGGRKGDGDEKKVRVAVEGPIIVGAGPSGWRWRRRCGCCRCRSWWWSGRRGWRSCGGRARTTGCPSTSRNASATSPTSPSPATSPPTLPSPTSSTTSTPTPPASASPHFRRAVTHARFDRALSLWRVTALERRGAADSSPSPAQPQPQLQLELDFVVVGGGGEGVRGVRGAVCGGGDGENAEAVVPETKGRELFTGRVVHSSEYRSGEEYSGGKVLVVGCGNSGMEICLDLCEHGAMPFMSVRSGVHLLPRDICENGAGDTEKYGLKRPNLGPLETKHITGKTPVLDVGTLALIKAGKIQIVREVESLTSNGASLSMEVRRDSTL